MNRHPSEYFIKYLMSLTTEQAKKDDWVQYSLTGLALPEADLEYLASIRAEIAPNIPKNYQPNNRFHRDSFNFLKAQGIWSLHNPDEHTKDARNILLDLKARGLIEKLIMGRLDHKEIAKKVNSRIQTFFTAGAIGAYEHYFWNASIMKFGDWAKIFENTPKHESGQAIAILQGGAAMAMHVAGFQQQIESKMVLRTMLEAVFFDMMEWKSQPRSIARTKAYSMLAKSAVSIDNQLSQSDAAIKEALAAFERFRMNHEAKEVPDIRKIAPAGNFSQSGAKLLDTGRPEKEEVE